MMELPNKNFGGYYIMADEKKNEQVVERRHIEFSTTYFKNPDKEAMSALIQKMSEENDKKEK